MTIWPGHCSGVSKKARHRGFHPCSNLPPLLGEQHAIQPLNQFVFLPLIRAVAFQSRCPFPVELLSTNQAALCRSIESSSQGPAWVRIESSTSSCSSRVSPRGKEVPCSWVTPPCRVILYKPLLFHHEDFLGAVIPIRTFLWHHPRGCGYFRFQERVMSSSHRCCFNERPTAR